MRAVVAELPGFKTVPFPRRGEAPQAPAADHDGAIGRLPDVDAELAQDGEIAFDVVGTGNISDGAGPVARARPRTRRVARSPCLPAGAKRCRRRSSDRVRSSPGFQRAGRRLVPALGLIRMWYDMRSMTSVSVSSLSVSS